MRESVYLYSNDQKDLYENEVVKQNNRTCLFSRHLGIYLEKGTASKTPFYESHLAKCPHCQQKAKEYVSQLKLVNELLPKYFMTDKTRKLLDKNTRELAERFRFQLVKKQFGPYKNNIKLLKSTIRDFSLSFVKLSSLKGFLLAALSFSIIYFLSSINN